MTVMVHSFGSRETHSVAENAKLVREICLAAK